MDTKNKMLTKQDFFNNMEFRLDYDNNCFEIRIQTNIVKNEVIEKTLSAYNSRTRKKI